MQQISSKVIVIVEFALKPQILDTGSLQPISGRVHGAPATETVDAGSISGQVKPKTIKIGIRSFLAWRSAIKGTV